MCDWMGKIEDETPLESVNIPGTHDTATWNYTQEVQDRYLDITTQGIGPAIMYQCQDQSIFSALNHGIRAFDLRIGLSPLDNTSIIFYHGSAIMSLEATLEDVFYGYYKFLDDNPSETIVVSIKVDNTTWGTPEKLESEVYNLIFSEPASSYFVQLNGSLPTIGEARGKMVLLRRYDDSKLPLNDTKEIGLAVPPNVWLDNVANFSIEYASSKFAYIEDYYEIGGPDTVDSYITWKYNATTAHLIYAGQKHMDSLFITFASAEKDSESVWPRIIALGNGTARGVNQRLTPWLKERSGQRRGLVFLDWWKQVPGLVESVIDL
ncbi:PLC-like phosphodiesterase [Kockovaella imperatae]|uniref:PLC-like phosphodiesterase n=1 Tax=Kockovaella imperatae TaxID=4999 RepID=A0A1Y1UP03_9TREE|nr:PLC-like phosphodiesterase [Kockovaella imperatae]ORX39778.1 PLC-like phosphodiesterase [Kockovaella imperatae]